MKNEKAYKEMGELEFWNTNLVYYRNKVSQAKTEDELAESLDLLKTCRESKRMAEELIFARLKIILIIIHLAVITTILSSCNAVGGLGRDITWMGEAGQKMLEHGHETMDK